ncbi:MAG: hypothetical protein RBT49_01140 [Bacteroidales bacterium]|jgi:KaiC/GvpD/RAD55 family RecA-like ATPase|nr:hypothetical protein [Bacteroidales bacterium]
MKEYILPTLSIFNNFDELTNDANFLYSYNNYNKYNDNLLDKKAFIIGEPGTGKSTLLRKIAYDHLQRGNRVLVKNLSKITNILLTDFLEERRDIEIWKEQSIFEFIEIKSDSFELINRKDITICLDALDEVKPNLLKGLIYKLKQFAQKYSDINLYVSCRTHYLKSEVDSIKDFKLVLIRPFNNDEIRSYLVKNIAAQKQNEIIEPILEKVKTNEGISPLTIPRYLEVQKDTIENNQFGYEQIIKMTRIDYFENFIFKKLESEDKDDKNKNKTHISKRILEKIALIMEIYQCNSITKDELITLLDNLDSNLVNIFLNQVSIDNFIYRVLKLTDETIEFDNTEFQEYLAAKELLRLGKKKQIIYDLIVEKNTLQIFKNWYDVLYYIVEIEPEYFLTILSFLKQKKGFQIDDNFLTFLKVIDINKFSEENKNTIFYQLFNYIQDSGKFLYYDHAKLLSTYYSETNHKLLQLNETINNQNEERIIANKLLLIFYLIEAKKISVKGNNELEKIIINFAANEEHQYVNDFALDIIPYFESINTLKKLDKKIDKNKSLINKFLKCCYNTKPNSDFVIEKLYEGITQNREEAIDGICHITDINKLHKVLKRIIGDEKTLDFFLELNYRRIEHSKHELINTLSSHWNEEIREVILELTKEAIKSVYYTTRENDFLSLFIGLLIKKDKKEILNIISLVERDYDFRTFVYHLLPFIELEDIKPIIDFFETSNSRYAKHNLYYAISSSKRQDKDKLVAELKKYTPDVISEIVSKQKKDKIDTNNQIYQQFNSELYFDIKKGKYKLSVFKTFYDNKEIIYNIAGKKDLELLKSIILNVFEHVDPIKFDVKINEVKKDSTNYTVNNIHFHNYAYYLLVGIELGLNKQLKKYRRKIINYIPFAGNYSIKVGDNHYSSKDEIDLILNFIGTLKEDEIKELVNNINNRTDDLIKLKASQIIKIANKVKNKGFIPIVRGLINDDENNIYVKIEGIKCLINNYEDKQFVKNKFNDLSKKEYFENFSFKNASDTNRKSEIIATFSNNTEFELVSVINEELIKLNDKESIIWRFNTLKSRALEHVIKYETGARFLSQFDAEIEHPQYANCIIDRQDINLVPHFNDLLKFSFRLQMNKNLVAYSKYLQTIIYNFYLKIIYKAGVEIITDLKNIINQFSPTLTNSFKSSLKIIESEFIKVHSKPNNIEDCIRAYNDLKSKDYMQIDNSYNLRFIIVDIIENELSNFIANQGFYKTIEKYNNLTETIVKDKIDNQFYLEERTIQDFLKIQFESYLLKRGVRNSDIYKEVELYDRKRIDLLIKYGFIGPIMIEIKLLHNNDIRLQKERKKYKKKLRQYIKGTNADYGIYLIFKVKNIKSHDESYFRKLINDHEDINNLTVKVIDCTKHIKLN